MVKDASTIARMRRTGALAAEILAAVAASVRPGVTTDDLDELGHTLAITAGAYPSPLGYGPKYNLFPKSLCTSVNEEICHGIPGTRVLAEGDIVSIDVTVYREGVHGDTCVTVPVGTVDDDGRRLIETTRAALDAAIATVGPGEPLRRAGQAIETLAAGEGFSVVRDFVGHGVGAEFHTDPRVPHYDEPRFQTVCQPGMTFTIEPMIAERDWRAEMLDDGWTAVTADGGRVAQFEHTLAVTDDGVDVLTTPA
jgi:methionyl aminopeptidase